MVSVREIRIWQSVDAITGFIVIAVGLIRLQSHVGLMEALAFLAVLFMGGLMIYSFWMILTTAAFWIVRIEEISELFQGVYAAGRYPIGIYPGWLRLGLTFLVPVAFAVTVPSEALTGRLSGGTLLGAAALTALLLALSRAVWSLGLRRYSGASA
jgi:ABC-2 type transport system permease protein